MINSLGSNVKSFSECSTVSIGKICHFSHLFIMGANVSRNKTDKKAKQGLYAEMQVTKNNIIEFTPNVLEMKKSEYSKIHDSGFYGEWSRFLPCNDYPRDRHGHFTAYDPVNQIMYIGYGIGKNGKLLTDIWGLNLNNLAWTKVPIPEISQIKSRQIKNNLISGRSNSSACYLEDHLYVFGGFVSPNYSNSLHKINVNTGKFSQLETTGDKPIPMSSCILAAYGQKLVLYGGFDRTYHTDLYVLNLNTMEWKKIPTNLHGRTSLPYTIYGKDLYSYGGSDNGTLLHLDLDREEIEELPVHGACPPNDAQGTNVTSSEDYVFWLGGRSSLNYDYLFMMRKKTNKWSVLHLRPDNDSVFVDDGKLDSLNLFAMPHIEGFSIQYNEKNRCIISTLGRPFRDHEFINVYNISEALSFVHMRDDMCDCLKEFTFADIM